MIHFGILLYPLPCQGRLFIIKYYFAAAICDFSLLYGFLYNKKVIALYINEFFP